MEKRAFKNTPLTIKFETGTKVLGIGNFEKSDDSIEVTPKIDAEKALIILPLFDSKESITFTMLLDRNADYFPKVFARIRGKKRIVRANNVRTAREEKIFGFVALGLVALLWLLLFSPFGLAATRNNEFALWYKLRLGAMLLGGIYIILTSWITRRMPPSDRLTRPSMMLLRMLKDFLVVLPFLIFIGLIVAGLIALLGIMKGLAIFFIAIFFFFCFLVPPFLWYSLNFTITDFFKKRNKAYNARLVALLAGILPLAMEYLR